MSQSPTADAGRTVLLVGTLDTKGEEFEFLRERLRLAGVGALMADVGTLEPPRASPTSRARRSAPKRASTSRRWARRGPRSRDRRHGRRGRGAGRAPYDEGRIHGVLSAGGSGNTAIATAAMQTLPVGVPKLMVSTMAAGETSDYVGGVDVMMMASVTDVAGINSISSRILANAAAAMAGMVLAPRRSSKTAVR